MKFYFIDTSKNLLRHFFCRHCEKTFSFNNKFHYHFRRCKIIINKSITSKFSTIINHSIKIKIIRSSTSINSTFELDFRFWFYVKIKININSNENENDVCVDIDCETSFIDHQFLIKWRSNYVFHVLRKTNSFKINDINFVSLFINEYIIVDFNIVEKVDDKSIKINFIKFLHVVDELKTNKLINNDILKSKKIMSNINKNIMNINNCDNLIVSLTIISRKKIKLNVQFVFKLWSLFQFIFVSLYQLKYETTNCRRTKISCSILII